MRFTEADLRLGELEALLATHAIEIAHGSRLEEIVLMLAEYLALHRREMTIGPTTDRRDHWLRMLALVDLAVKILGAAVRPHFGRFIPHLKLFASKEVDPSQNAPTSMDDQNNHKLFELLVGVSCDRFCDDLVLEHPNSKDTKTPDLTVSFEGQRWGVACKVLHSTKPTTYRDRIVDGISQIDRADVDRGIVLLNAKNLVPLDEVLPFGRKSEEQPYEVFETDEAWSTIMHRLQKELAARTHEQASDLRLALRDSRAEALVAHYFQCMFLKRIEGQARMSPLSVVVTSYLATGPSEVDPRVLRFIANLTNSVAWGQSSTLTETREEANER